jgi:hypothetical protein
MSMMDLYEYQKQSGSQVPFIAFGNSFAPSLKELIPSPAKREATDARDYVYANLSLAWRFQTRSLPTWTSRYNKILRWPWEGMGFSTVKQRRHLIESVRSVHASGIGRVDLESFADKHRSETRSQQRPLASSHWSSRRRARYPHVSPSLSLAGLYRFL